MPAHLTDRPATVGGRRCFVSWRRKLDDGEIYERDLPELTQALNGVLTAYERRLSVRERARIGRGRYPPTGLSTSQAVSSQRNGT